MQPDVALTCCPAYTIRLDTDKFVASKDHRSVQKKLESFLSGAVEVVVLSPIAYDDQAPADVRYVRQFSDHATDSRRF